MKTIKDFISEMLYYDERRKSNVSKIVRGIKKDFKDEFGDDVQLAHARTNGYTVYDIYCYRVSEEIFKRIGEILAARLRPKFKPFTKSELEEKMKKAEEYCKKYDLDDMPFEFGRMDSRGLDSLDNPHYRYGLLY